MRFLNGANRVTEKLIMGYDIFMEEGINLRYLYTDSGRVKCADYVSNLGNYNTENKYERKIISILKKTPLYRSYGIQKSRQEKVIASSQKSVEKYFENNERADYLIFQDIFSAYHFLNSRKSVGEKILVISHADTDPLEQLLMNRPELCGRKEEFRIRKIYETVFTKADKVVSICHSSTEYMRNEYNIKPICIHNGIEDTCFVHEKNQNGKLNIVILGSVIYRKGHDILVEAVNRLPPKERSRVLIHVIGVGNEFEFISNRISELKLDSNFVLYGLRTDIDRLLSEMDVMVLPSRADTVPIAIIEGLRAGLPIFATPLGEIPFMISGCGGEIEASVQSVYKLLMDLCNDEYNLAQFAKNSREKYEHNFSLNQMIHAYADAILL